MKYHDTGCDERFLVRRSAAVLRHRVSESIRNAIFVGRFKPGDRLLERELCELTGVSRTLVREALRQLEAERLIKVIPYRGPIVAKMSASEANDVYRVREELEGLACQLFAERATIGQIEDLKDALIRLRESYAHDDSLDRLQAKNYFYECLLSGAGNEALSNSLRLLTSQIMLLRSMSMAVPGRTKDSLAELEVLVSALSARDPKSARLAGAQHVRNASLIAVELLLEQAKHD
ncbi:MAG: GntR family transcriptional regulator [Castellaniella sp.]